MDLTCNISAPLFSRKNLSIGESIRPFTRRFALLKPPPKEILAIRRREIRSRLMFTPQKMSGTLRSQFLADNASHPCPPHHFFLPIQHGSMSKWVPVQKLILCRNFFLLYCISLLLFFVCVRPVQRAMALDVSSQRHRFDLR
jgi:hypothetical protein